MYGTIAKLEDRITTGILAQRITEKEADRTRVLTAYLTSASAVMDAYICTRYVTPEPSSLGFDPSRGLQDPPISKRTPPDIAATTEQKIDEDRARLAEEERARAEAKAREDALAQSRAMEEERARQEAERREAERLAREEAERQEADRLAAQQEQERLAREEAERLEHIQISTKNLPENWPSLKIPARRNIVAERWNIPYEKAVNIEVADLSEVRFARTDIDHCLAQFKSNLKDALLMDPSATKDMLRHLKKEFKEEIIKGKPHLDQIRRYYGEYIIDNILRRIQVIVVHYKWEKYYELHHISVFK